MRNLFCLLLLLGSVFVTGARAAPDIDPTAVLLLDQSARAYSGLRTVAMDFAIMERIDRYSLPSDGTLLISRPDKAKIVYKSAKGPSFVLSDGSKIIVQHRNREYRVDSYKDPYHEGQSPLLNTLCRVSTPLALAFAPLATGESPLRYEPGRWQSAVALPDKSVQMTGFLSQDEGAPLLKFHLFFDPASHLLRHATIGWISRRVNLTVDGAFSNVRRNPSFSPATFRFKPVKGDRLVQQ